MRHPLVALSLVLVAMLSVLDVAAGVTYRAVAGHTFFDRDSERARSQHEVRERRYRVASPLYHHDLAPRRSFDDVSWGPHAYRLRTNSMGFRDSEVREVSLTSSAPRIMFIGDSFTEGVGFDYERTFVGIVDSTLRDVEVLNAGVVSYSPSIYERKARYFLDDVGLEIDELIVFMDISDAMDEARMYERTPAGRIQGRPDSVRNAPIPADPVHGEGVPTRLRSLLRDNTVVAATLIKLARTVRYRSGTLPTIIIVGERGTWTLDSTVFRSYGEEGLILMSEAMERLNDLLRRHEAELTVVVYPWPVQIVNRDRDSRQVRFWRNWCAQRGVRFINLFPVFIPSDAEPDPEATVRQYYVDSDVHWNALGHRLVAESFLQQYRLPTARLRADAGPAASP